ncbi:class I SAM-dependent methyltransferase [Candidatus Hydrogenedentota bacterium]
MSNDFHEANRNRWDAGSAQWARGADLRGLWRRCPDEPELVLSPRELAYLRDIGGKDVCVLGSGDNQVVFALAGLGGVVTSVDISQNQLDVARGRAEELGLSISFIRADVTDLSAIASETFDIVYTGGHVAVWVSDLDTYYAEAARILRPGGLFIVAEYHPFRRVWKESHDELVVESSYFERGPYEYDASEDILHPKPGAMKSYEFHWTISDFINAVLKAGCRILEIDEFNDEVSNWECAAMKGLPECFVIFARKEKN